jgi:hypothetical protein
MRVKLITLDRPWLLALIVMLGIFTSCVFLRPQLVEALNITQYRDLITDSGPIEYANHTLEFTLGTAISPSSSIEITMPEGFTAFSTSTFAERNVELLVNGVPRTATTSASPGVDQVEIVPGTPAFFRYTLAPDFSIAAGSELQIKIGNHTTNALLPSTIFSTTTGTTTTDGDIEPILNSTTTGAHKVKVEVYDGALVANADFTIFLNEKVRVPGADTRETVPPYRFGPSPTSTVGGTTLYVEISLETDELSVCKFSTASGTPFASIPNTFVNTGMIFHSDVVPVTPNSLNQFYVRCIDDEGNFNIDDFVIEFTVNDIPTGIANTDGDVSGDGSGSGNEGTGDGSGSGGTTGESNGEAPLLGGSAGTGGSGGGGGGGSGDDDGDEAGGGFESTDAPYRSGDGRVIISGYAYPNSTVGVLVDGNFFDTTKANGSGEYSITLDEIARGVYTFGIYASGPDNTRSSTFSTSFTVTGARTSALSNVNIAPSILVTPDPVNPGETLTASGYALPNATVSIQNGKMRASIVKDTTVTSNSSGLWTTTIDTGNFSKGTYQIRAKSAQEGGVSTNWSEYTFYGVGEEAAVPINADLNRDGKVNLVDFSILLFWWNTSGGDSDPPADINRDTKVNLTDFSIMLFNWTG